MSAGRNTNLMQITLTDAYGNFSEMFVCVFLITPRAPTTPGIVSVLSDLMLFPFLYAVYPVFLIPLCRWKCFYQMSVNSNSFSCLSISILVRFVNWYMPSFLSQFLVYVTHFSLSLSVYWQVFHWSYAVNLLCISVYSLFANSLHVVIIWSSDSFFSSTYSTLWIVNCFCYSLFNFVGCAWSWASAVFCLPFSPEPFNRLCCCWLLSTYLVCNALLLPLSFLLIPLLQLQLSVVFLLYFYLFNLWFNCSSPTTFPRCLESYPSACGKCMNENEYLHCRKCTWRVSITSSLKYIYIIESSQMHLLQCEDVHYHSYLFTFVAMNTVPCRPWEFIFCCFQQFNSSDFSTFKRSL